MLATCLADADYKEDKWILQYTVFTCMTKSWDPFTNRTNGMEEGGVNSIMDIKYKIWVQATGV